MSWSEEAIKALKQNRYDLALVDLKMPGIDGFEVTRFINETLGRQTVVVIVSALATVEAAMEVTHQGAFDFLVKPFTLKDLQHVVERAVRKGLDRIFMNLISNGIKYNRENGSLTVKLENREDGVIVKVSDTGIGMSEKEMAGLFEEFYRVKNPQTSGVPGTGLGLATVKRVISEYNGEIQVESKPGDGTTFTVFLPAAGDGSGPP